MGHRTGQLACTGRQRSIGGTPLAPPEKGSNEPNKCFLHKIQAMFGYLHESQKKFYDTRELCASCARASSADARVT